MIKNLSMAGLLGLFSGVATYVFVEGGMGFGSGLIFGAFMIPLVIYVRKKPDAGQIIRIMLFSGLSFPVAFFSGMATSASNDPTLDVFVASGAIGAAVLYFGFHSKEISQRRHLIHPVFLFGILGGLLAIPADLLDFMNNRDNTLVVFTIWQTGMAMAIGYILAKEQQARQNPLVG